MFSFSAAINYKDVPTSWIYSHYLGVTKPLDGRNIRVRSFLTNDSNPSLWLYFKKGQYKWKDFSSGQGGGPIDLVMEKEKLNFVQACNKVTNDYNTYVRINGHYRAPEISVSLSAYNLTAKHEIRDWNRHDHDFWWGRFGLREKKCDHYCIMPLDWYQLQKISEEKIIEYKPRQGENIYGYFNIKGDLYQIYQPYNKEMKFIKLERQIQGEDQLKGEADVLIIGSSLKDIMCTTNYGLEIEAVAPPSETTFLSQHEISHFKTWYPYVFTMFDNDPAGIKAMLRYKELYDIDYIYMPFQKDIAEFAEKSPFYKVKEELTIRINKKLEKCRNFLLTEH